MATSDLSAADGSVAARWLDPKGALLGTAQVALPGSVVNKRALPAAVAAAQAVLGAGNGQVVVAWREAATGKVSAQALLLLTRTRTRTRARAPACARGGLLDSLRRRAESLGEYGAVYLARGWRTAELMDLAHDHGVAPSRWRRAPRESLRS